MKPIDYIAYVGNTPVEGGKISKLLEEMRRIGKDKNIRIITIKPEDPIDNTILLKVLKNRENKAHGNVKFDWNNKERI